jgi:alginate O-acetyltransferase complex protein AlgJ
LLGYWRRQVDALEQSESLVLAGRDGWMFFRSELRHLTVGPFWGEAAREVSAAANLDYSDPLPAIVDFHQQLQSVGVELLLVPVPAKASIYPEKTLVQSDPKISPEDLDRAGNNLNVFLDLLRQEGVRVVDLAALFLAEREQRDLYLRQDTHWSPAGIEIAANSIAGLVKEMPWYASLDRLEFDSEAAEVPVRGDLWQWVPEAQQEVETVSTTRVLQAEERRPVSTDESSPVLLLGDSHTLVFHAGGDLHGAAAGFPDQLALRLGIAVDLIGVRGSGSTAARLNLMRRRDNLAGKKAVIWLFASREFTESTGGWRKVPVVRN